MIETIDKKIVKIKEFGSLLFDKYSSEKMEPLLEVVNFEKGKEVGALNYLSEKALGSVPYIRVGTLLNGEYDTFVFADDLPFCNTGDILIAFDGAPGRNNIGLCGFFSSGIQKIVCNEDVKGYVYFYINSAVCQNTIKENAQGTTILHAGKAIRELMMPIIKDKKNLQDFRILFSEMVSLIEKKSKLKQEKTLLLQKYFG